LKLSVVPRNAHPVFAHASEPRPQIAANRLAVSDTILHLHSSKRSLSIPTTTFLYLIGKCHILPETENANANAGIVHTDLPIAARICFPDHNRRAAQNEADEEMKRTRKRDGGGEEKGGDKRDG